MKASFLLGVLPLVTSTSVCVTGAGGFVATEIISQLLSAGYHVKGSVRSLENTAKYEHLTLLDAALPGSFTAVEADLLKHGSFAECVLGTSAVIHTASPFHFDSKDMKEDMLNPAVEGTKNVMAAAAKAGIKKVVLTSSLAAVTSFQPGDQPKSGSTFSEEDWNEYTTEESWGDNPMQAYFSSKSLAEQAAESMAKAAGIELVTICPSLVMGPVLYKRLDSVSVNLMKDVVEGAPLAFNFPWVDSRDVARAHIAALREGVSGRYLASSAQRVTPDFVRGVLVQNFPSLSLAEVEAGGDEVLVDNAKIYYLIGSFLPMEDTVADMARSLIAAGLADPNAAGKKEL